MSLRDVDSDSNSKSQFRITQHSLIPAFIRGIYPETAKWPDLSLHSRENFAANKGTRGLYPRKNFLQWIYFTPESLRLCLSSWRETTITFRALRSLRRRKDRQNGDDRRYGASRRSCAHIYLGTTARNVIRKVSEFQIGHPERCLPLIPVPGRCFPVWCNFRVFPLFVGGGKCRRALTRNSRKTYADPREYSGDGVRFRRHLSVHWPDRMM